MTRDETDLNVLQPVLGNLERMLIDEFLRLRGLDRHALDALPDSERHDLLAEASTYASARLTEIESRSHYIHELHGVQDAGRAPSHAPATPQLAIEPSLHAHVDSLDTKHSGRRPEESEAGEKPHGPWMTS